MTIAVWADVGGTFTDCLISDGESRHETKVLSTGTVRAAVKSFAGDRTLELEAFPASAIEQFWRGATVSSLDSSGNRQSLGQVRDHLGSSLILDESHELLPSSNEQLVVELDAGIEAPVLATRLILGIPLSDPLPELDVRMGTTRGTNALLTRAGAKTALVVTEGFGDVLRIGEQDRPDLFSLAIEKPSPLAEHVVEVTERLDASGKVLTEIDLARLKESLSKVKAHGIESLAVCLLHAHTNDVHERAVVDLASELGIDHVSRSSEVAPLIKLVSRAETTTLDAYLNPILAGYVTRVWDQFGGPNRCRLRLMTSGGNLVEPSSFRGRDSILSGPAGGVVALGHVASRSGCEAAIGLDMGGTSTDVSRFEGQVGRRFESRVAGVRVMTPMMDIETVAAGGGSICDYVDHRLSVGPKSAGADPGPACYGRGGPLTVTDVNVLLGRIPESRFPFPLRRAAAESKLQEILQRVRQRDAIESPEALAEGFLNIAVTHMAEAVRTVSTAQGSDVRNMALVGFGGAAGQHLCRVADALGMTQILDHPDAGMLSALGMGLADIGRVVTRGQYRVFSDTSEEEIESTVTQLRSEADALLADEGETDQRATYHVECDVRYQGTESYLSIDLYPSSTLVERFHQAHQNTFGYVQQKREVELVAIRCEATLSSVSVAQPERTATKSTDVETIRLWHHSQWVDAQLIDRSTLSIGDQIQAPAMIVSPHSTLVVEPGWTASVIEEQIIKLTPVDSYATAEATESANDPVLLEVIARRLQGIADSMGEVLRRTSISVNVKERRDYSCAVFRSDGSLVANAPHVPVHLGAMGHTVRRIQQVFPSMSPGDCYLSNDPFSGGSHLPDITAVSPVFCATDSEGSPDFFVASRAHHAELGGRTPGSMPPDAVSLAEEGVLIRDFALVRGGVSHVSELESLLRSGPYPSRSPEENIADIAAQQAAGAFGAEALAGLAAGYTPAIIDAYMKRLLDVAGDSLQEWVRSLPGEPMHFVDRLDDGTEIGVKISRHDSRLTFALQTGPVHPHGFNATRAIVTAAVLYVLRCVSGSNLPLCDGVLRDVDIQIPSGLLDPPAHEDPSRCAAVVAGNVETSQRIVDVLLGALGVAAASQGTMNNVLMGDDQFGYYETIGGGSGATFGHEGADAVHTHMTNTRITDPEVLESRLPVRLCQFRVRQDSGGAGAFRGGNGIVREFEFLRPLVVSLITGRRTVAPYGASGGGDGKTGRNLWLHNNQWLDLPPTSTFDVAAGERLRIETPGGGGWGSVCDKADRQ